MTNDSNKLAVIGECMLELHKEGDTVFHMDYAGDVYNVAVYFSRAIGAAGSVDLVTAVGDDLYSQRMMSAWKAQGVGVKAAVLKNRMSGLYFVETDALGEREFYYYRTEAAARDMFDQTELLDSLDQYDAIYFSGITLAILNESSRHAFLEKLATLKKAGVPIYFDTNYRAKLWPSREVAIEFFNRVLPLIEIALPSGTDMAMLYGDKSLEACASRLLDAGVKKAMITDGEQGYYIATANAQEFCAVIPVKAIDTTGAGDSFNGAYLAAVMQGDSDEAACKKAAALASQVVQCSGAIMPL